MQLDRLEVVSLDEILKPSCRKGRAGCPSLTELLALFNDNIAGDSHPYPLTIQNPGGKLIVQLLVGDLVYSL